MPTADGSTPPGGGDAGAPAAASASDATIASETVGSGLTRERVLPDIRADAEEPSLWRRARLTVEEGRALVFMPANLGRPFHPRIALKAETKWAPERGLWSLDPPRRRQIRRNARRRSVLSN